MTTQKQDSEEAKRIYLNGMAALAKLIEARIANDIKTTELRLHHEEAKKSIGSGLVGQMSNSLLEKERSKLRQEIATKRTYRDEWWGMVWEGITAAGGNTPHLLQKPLVQCMASYAGGPHGDLAKFSLLQEAILAPVYPDSEGLPKGLKELVALNEQAKFVAGLAGFPTELGTTICNESEAFVKGAQNYWSKVLSATTITAVTVTGAALLAAPIIAPIIGGMAGLTGAAAFTHGLALLGGGSLAAGGLGMQGGLFVLGFGGGIVGATAGGKGTSAYLNRLPKEATTLTLCKLVNYLQHLNTISGRELSQAQAVRRELIDDFLQNKHIMERDALTSRTEISSSTHSMENIRIFHYTYLKILESLPTRKGQ